MPLILASTIVVESGRLPEQDQSHSPVKEPRCCNPGVILTLAIRQCTIAAFVVQITCSPRHCAPRYNLLCKRLYYSLSPLTSLLVSEDVPSPSSANGRTHLHLSENCTTCLPQNSEKRVAENDEFSFSDLVN
ncbi:hypothetical protein J6590_037341 [Homalodisca vitripennis]|nr:hypothetical protein J6590_037341 [Homalodisca vitripennis]